MAKRNPPNLEETLSKLEAVVTSLEQEQGDLGDSMEAFEQGIIQIRQAQQLLSEASQRVNNLVDGETKDEPQPSGVGLE